MFLLSPSDDAKIASTNLGRLIKTDVNPKRFRSSVRILQDRFNIYASTCPNPFIAKDLIVTPEIRRQSEYYLPIAEITRIFYRFYEYALTYPPVLSSTPFHKALSWADVLVSLPPRLQFSANPSELLKTVLSDKDLRTAFLFASFLPLRFYGGFRRYPEQMEFVREWLSTRRSCKPNAFRCLDAACGTGEVTYILANLMMENGFAPGEFQIEGITLEPLEVWTASHRLFPNNEHREAKFRAETNRLFEGGYQTCIRFRCSDLIDSLFMQSRIKGGTTDLGCFDLILCNGILGGPIINEMQKIKCLASNLSYLLAPGGILLAANNFHGGWKSKISDTDLKTLFSQAGLQSFDAGGGIGGLKQ